MIARATSHEHEQPAGRPAALVAWLVLVLVAWLASDRNPPDVRTSAADVRPQTTSHEQAPADVATSAARARADVRPQAPRATPAADVASARIATSPTTRTSATIGASGNIGTTLATGPARTIATTGHTAPGHIE